MIRRRPGRGQALVEQHGRDIPVSGAPSVDGLVPLGVRIAGAWSWRILAVLAVLAVVVFLTAQLSLIVIPFFIAVLLAALLVPLVAFLVRHRWPKWLAVAVAEIGMIVVIAGLVVLIVTQITSGLDELKAQTLRSYGELKNALMAPPFNLTSEQIAAYVSDGWQALQDNTSLLLSGALSVGTSVGHFLAGFLVALFSTLFILIDGRAIWLWIVRLFPRRARAAVDMAGSAGWTTLGNFVRVQILVAAIDAIGIAAGAAILQLPLAIPIGVLVFLGSFIPVVGAVVTGALAVFVALIYHGWAVALVMLGIVLLVQQIEGHVLQPLIMGTAVKVHPLAVVLAVLTGSLLAGIPGAFFAVPLVAVLNVMIKTIASGAWRTGSSP